MEVATHNNEKNFVKIHFSENNFSIIPYSFVLLEVITKMAVFFVLATRKMSQTNLANLSLIISFDAVRADCHIQFFSGDSFV